MWYEKYIGIPFQANGRDQNGLDCWGLVRLIYEKEYDIILPSFSTEYTLDDDERIKDLISQYKEGWQQLESPTEGCVVLFRILGDITHIGVMISNTQFIHVQEGSNTVLENITNIRWNNRVVGYFRYNEAAQIHLTALPHPLKTTKVDKILLEGINLEQLFQDIITENNIPPELSKNAIIMVNSIPIPRTEWASTILKASDRVEYRGLVGKNEIRTLALVIVAAYAPYLAVQAFGATAGTLTATGMVASMTTFGYVATAVITVAGGALIQAISPVRPPRDTDPGTPEQQNLINGANNPYNPYGPIPVVLGKIRYSPPVGAKSFVSYPEDRESYLNMLLLWGYGPLTISDYRVGEVAWDNYKFNEALPGETDLPTSVKGRITLDRKIAENTATFQKLKENFDKIYGIDVDQKSPAIELFGPEYIEGMGEGTEQTIRLNDIEALTINPITGVVINTYINDDGIWDFPTPPPSTEG